jgi:hypothetical protein
VPGRYAALPRRAHVLVERRESVSALTADRVSGGTRFLHSLAIAMTSWPLVRLLRKVRERAEAVDLLLAPWYFRYLCDLYGFVASVESALGICQFTAVRVRARLDALAAELRVLGADPEELALAARATATPLIFTAAEALGWLFVIERAALKAARMRHRLAYGTDVDSDSDRNDWLELGRYLMSEVRSDVDMKQMTSGALEALDHLEDWAFVTTAKNPEPEAQYA